MKKRTVKQAQAVAAYWEKDLDKKHQWYDIQASGETTEIKIFDVIGWPFIEAFDFTSDLEKTNTKKVQVNINSPGGDVFDGVAIYNALLDHPAEITTYVSGLAASIASIIAMAGNKRTIAPSGFMMIHSPWTFALGNADDIEKETNVLRKIESTMADIYAEKTGKSSAKMLQAMKNETWYSGQEAVQAGLAEQVLIKDKNQKQAKFDLSMFKKAPAVAGETTKRQIERVLMQDAGLTRSQARDLMQNGYGKHSMQDAGDAVKQLIEKIRGK